MIENSSAKNGTAPNWEKFEEKKRGWVTLWDVKTHSRARCAYSFGEIRTGKSRVWECYQLTLETQHGEFSARDSSTPRMALRQLQQAVQARCPDLVLLVAGLTEDFSE